MTFRRLTAAAAIAALAFGSAAARERPARPTTLYLSTGTADGGCTPTELTTRPTGSSNCGSLIPTGGETTWRSPATDEGYPFSSPEGAEVEGQVTIGPDVVGVQDYTVAITVELNGEVFHSQETTHADGLMQEDLVLEFAFTLEELLEVETASVTVAINGVAVRSNFVDGSGGSFLKFPPVVKAA